MRKGKVFVLSGPSGVGKGSICRELLKEVDMELSISMTTRDPRKGEEDGISYYFVSREEFEKNIKEDGFLEYAQIYENYYGTPKKKVLEKLEAGKDVLLEIEMQGALQAKASYDEAVLIFVIPPSIKDLRKRLEHRGTESEDKINMRVSRALSEMEYLKKYDYYVVNDKLENAVSNVKKIIDAEHSKTENVADEIINRFKEEI